MKTMKTFTTIMALAAVVVAVSLLLEDRQRSGDEGLGDQRPQDLALPAPGVERRSSSRSWALSDDNFGLMWISDDFKRELAVDAWRFITVRTTEFLPSGNEIYDHNFSTSYDIQVINSRGSHALVMAGEARNGAMVVEHWVIPPHQGAFISTVDVALNPSGTPAPLGTPTPVAPLVTTLVGGLSTPIQQRIPTPQAQRTELYRGTDHGNAVSIAPDPDGRFVIVLTDTSQLVQFDLLDETTLPFVLADSSSHWPLDTAEHMIRVQHDIFGRVWFVGSDTKPGPNGQAQESTYVIFMDLDNDGIFETDTMMLDFALMDSVYMDTALISNQFIGY